MPLCGNGFSFGVYDDGLLAGIAIAELQTWNNTLWVHEFHLAPEYRGRGLGRGLMNSVVTAARAASVRVIACDVDDVLASSPRRVNRYFAP